MMVPVWAPVLGDGLFKTAIFSLLYLLILIVLQILPLSKSLTSSLFQIESLTEKISLYLQMTILYCQQYPRYNT